MILEIALMVKLERVVGASHLLLNAWVQLKMINDDVATYGFPKETPYDHNTMKATLLTMMSDVEQLQTQFDRLIKSPTSGNARLETMGANALYRHFQNKLDQWVILCQLCMMAEYRNVTWTESAPERNVCILCVLLRGYPRISCDDIEKDL